MAGEPKFKIMLFIFLFGALGGFVHWLYQLYNKLLTSQDLVVSFFVCALICLVLGGISAIIGVFYIYSDNIENITRSLVVAIIFGFGFNSVFSNITNQELLKSTITSYEQQNSQLQTSLLDARLNTIYKSNVRQEVLARQTVEDMKSDTLDGRLPAVKTIKNLEKIGEESINSQPKVTAMAAKTIKEIAEKEVTGSPEAEKALEQYTSADRALKVIQQKAKENRNIRLNNEIISSRIAMAKNLTQNHELDKKTTKNLAGTLAELKSQTTDRELINEADRLITGLADKE